MQTEPTGLGGRDGIQEVFEVIKVSAEYPVRLQTEPTGLGGRDGIQEGLKLSRFPRSIRFGWETEPTGPGSRERHSRGFEVIKVSAEYPVRLGNRTYRAWEPRTAFKRVLKLLRLPCRIRFGWETEPTGLGDREREKAERI